MGQERLVRPERSTASVRRWLAAVLRAKDVPPTLWGDEYLQETVAAYIAGHGPLRDIRTAGRRILSTSRKIASQYHVVRSAPLATTSYYDPKLLTERERARCRAYEAHIARLVGRRPDVIRVRETVLGGMVVGTDEVFILLQSPTLRYLSAAEHREWQIRGEGAPIVLLDETDDNVCLQLRADDSPHHIHREPGRAIIYPTRNKVLQQSCRYWEGSAIAELWAVAQRLATAFGWDTIAWIRFLVADERQEYQPYSVRTQFHVDRESDRAQAEIVGTFAPWLTEDTVRNVFQRTRGRPQHGRVTVTRVQARAFRVYAWVLDHRPGGMTPIDWKGLNREWNTENDKGEQFAYPSHLRRAFKQAEALVLEMFALEERPVRDPVPPDQPT